MTKRRLEKGGDEIDALNRQLDSFQSYVKRLQAENGLQRVLIASLRDVNKSLDERLIKMEGLK